MADGPFRFDYKVSLVYIGIVDPDNNMHFALHPWSPHSQYERKPRCVLINLTQIIESFNLYAILDAHVVHSAFNLRHPAPEICTPISMVFTIAFPP